MMGILKVLMIMMFVAMSGCGIHKTPPANNVLSVDQLVRDSTKYVSKIVDVKGEIKMDYHGPVLCDEKGTPCFYVVRPENVASKADFALVQDPMYEEYERLYINIASIQRTLGKAMLLGTFRGRFDNYILMSNGKETIVQNPGDRSSVRCRFVLQRVLELNIRSMEKK